MSISYSPRVQILDVVSSASSRRHLAAAKCHVLDVVAVSRCIVWLQTPDLSGGGVRPVPGGRDAELASISWSLVQGWAWSETHLAEAHCRTAQGSWLVCALSSSNEPPHACRFKSELGTAKVAERGICAPMCTETHPRSSGRIFLTVAASPIGAATAAPIKDPIQELWHADGSGGVWLRAAAAGCRQFMRDAASSCGMPPVTPLLRPVLAAFCCRMPPGNPTASSSSGCVLLLRDAASSCGMPPVTPLLRPVLAACCCCGMPPVHAGCRQSPHCFVQFWLRAAAAGCRQFMRDAASHPTASSSSGRVLLRDAASSCGMLPVTPLLRPVLAAFYETWVTPALRPLRALPQRSLVVGSYRHPAADARTARPDRNCECPAAGAAAQKLYAQYCKIGAIKARHYAEVEIAAGEARRGESLLLIIHQPP
ncbi:hypothetical protein Purlil1_12653 [Purpureocillium lilacinum]|uniref:Uncharacterized protein n=1 Tax=Purpureocillium lilacinum TaxID=33203 RepID=A0ABR0BGG3_PURLI|nr:hypothetical protein Purlil1_12653 [Purpureocillium lilacinum]